MNQAARLALCAVLSSALACTTQVDRSNPYDPNAPSTTQAKARVHGALTAASLQSAAGLTLTLTQNNQTVQQQTTAAGGLFTFADVTPGSYALVASPAGFVPLSLPLALAVGSDLDLGVITLQELSGADASEVSGVVTLTGQTDHSGTLVEAVGRAFTTVTDSAGGWRLPLVAGTYTLKFSHVNFQTTSATNVVVGAGEQKVVPPFALLSNPATLTGALQAELPAGGAGPLGGASVTLEPGGINTTTASDGKFTLSGIPAGSYLVRAQKEGYQEGTASALGLLGGETRALPAPLTLALSRGALSGKVTLTGQSSHGGTAVTLQPGGGTQLTGESGEFSFGNLLVGSYQITAQHDGYSTRVLGANFAVTAGATTDAGAFALLANPASVQLHVQAEVDGAAPADLADALCSVDGTSVAGATDSKGAVTLGGIPPGSYAVRCSKAPLVTGLVTALDLQGGEARVLPDALVLALPRGALTGVLQLAGTAAWSGTSVQLTPGGRTSFTSSDGAFTFDRLVAGSYLVSAQRDGWQQRALGPFTVVGGATTSAGTVTLAANPGTISGAVQGETAAGGSGPLQDAACALTGTSFNATTDAAGKFTFSGVPLGSYVLRCAKATYGPALVSVLSLLPGEARALADPLVLSLQRGAISGLVQLEGTSNATGVIVEVPSAGRTLVTGADGAFLVDRLIVGTYTVTARKDGYLSKVLGTFSVQADQTAPAGAFTLSSNPATLTGHVEGELPTGGKGPLAGANVSLDGSTLSGVVTAANGNFTLAGVPAGSYVLRVRAAGYRDATTAVLALAGGEVRALPDSFSLALARGSISGSVVLSDTTDSSGTIVELTGTGLAQVTPSSGTFNFAALVPGIYEVSARRDGYSRQVRGSLTVVADAVTTISPVITLTRQGGAISVPEAPFTRARAVHLVLQATNAVGYRASEDPTFTNAALGDVTTTAPHAFTPGNPVGFTLSDVDGAHDIYVVFIDATNNASAPAVGSLTLDRKKPEAPAFVINGGAAFTSAGSGIVTLSVTSAQDLPATTGAAVSGVGQLQISNFSDFSQPQTLAFNLTQTWTLDAPGTDGLKTVYLRLIDRAGNQGDITAAPIVLDTQKPAGPSITLQGSAGAGAGLTTSPVVTATLDASDANAGANKKSLLVKLANDPGFIGAQYQPFTSTVTWFLLPGDGAKTVYAQFADPAGNESLAVSANITLDQSAPAAPGITITELDSRPANGFTSSRAVKLTLASSGGPISAKVSENPSLSSATTYDLTTAVMPVDFTLSNTQGLHTLWVRFYDAAGNQSDLASASVTLDTVAPLPQAFTLAPSGFTNQTTVALTPPNAGQDELQVATGGATGLSGPTGFVTATPGVPINVTLTSTQGTKTFTVTYRDLADNTVTVAAQTLVLDTTAPAAVPFAVKGTLGDGTTSTTLTVTPVVTLDLSGQTDALSGIAQMALTNDGVNFLFQAFTSASSVPWTLTAGDGLKTVSAKFLDKAGNATAAAVVGTITLDTQGPTSPSLAITEGDGSENGYTKSTSVTLSLNAAGSAVKALVGEDPALAGATTIDLTGKTLPFSAPFTLGGAGTRTVYARYYDAAGNASSIISRSVVVDQTAPASLAPTLSPSGYTSSTGISLVPPSAGQDYVTLTGNLTAPLTLTAAPAGVAIPVTLSSGDGAKTINVAWSDSAGNVNTTPVSVSIVLDTTAPTAANFAITGALADATSSTSTTATQAVMLDLSSASDGAQGSGVLEMKVSSDPALTGASFVPYASTVPWTLAATQGLQTVYAQFRDRVGKTSAIVQGQITYDTTPPAAPVIAITEQDTPVAVQNGYTNNRAVKLTLTATGAPVRAVVSEDPSFPAAASTTFALPGAPPFAYTLLNADGVHTLYARFFDATGNGSATATAQVVLDRTAPAATAPVIGGAAVASVSGVTFAGAAAITLTAPAGAGQDTVTVSGAGLSPATAQTFTAPTGVALPLTLASGDGVKTFSVVWGDLAGNSAAAANVSVTLDGAKPAAVAFNVVGRLADNTASSALTVDPAVALDFSGVLDDQTAGAANASGVAFVKISNDPALSGAIYQPFAAAVPWTLQAGQGAQTVYAQFKDAVGNESNIASQTITLDSRAPGNPAIDFLETGDTRQHNGVTKSATVQLVLTANGSPKRVQYGTDPTFTVYTENATLTGPSPTLNVNYTLPGEGAWIVYARFFDAAGNESAVVQGDLIVDLTAPANVTATLSPSGQSSSASVLFVPPNALGDIDSVKFTTTAGKAGLSAPAGFTAVSPGLPIALTLDTTAPNTADGLRSFDVVWRDAADNTVPGGTYTINLDRTAPTGGALAINGRLADGTASTTVTAVTGVTVNFGTLTDLSGVASVMLSNDDNSFTGAQWQAFADPLPWTLPPVDGTHALYAKFMDKAGNASASPISKSIDLRSTPPSGGSLVIEGGALATSKVAPATASLAIGAQGASEMAIFSAGSALTGTSTAPWIAYATSASVALPAGDGNKNVLVRFRNQARVEGGSVSGNITLDTVAPQAASITLNGTLGDGSLSPATSTVSPATSGVLPANYTAVAAVVVQVTPPADDVTGIAFAQTTPAVACTAAGVFPASPAFVPFTASATQILTGSDGGKRLCVLLQDRAGNYSPGKAIGVDVTLDTTAPSNPSFVNITSGTTNQANYPGTGQVTITASTDQAPVSSAVTYQCLYGTGGWVDCANPASTTQPAFVLIKNQTNVLGIRARDAARNASPGSLISVTHDDYAPVAPNLTSALGSSDAIQLGWTASPSPDVVKYKVYYGFAAGVYNGTGAAQGVSPIDVGNVTSYRLSGLTTGTPYYVSIEAVDAAGNASGPTGERVVVPNRVNPRLLSAIGGSLQQMGVIGTQLYVASAQAVTQFDASDDSAGGVLAVNGRAAVPNLSPDPALPMTAFACTLQTTPPTPGHCAVPTGASLEGDYRTDRVNRRAPTPIVWFPPLPATQPNTGRVVAQLPVRAQATASNLYSDSTGNRFVLFAVDLYGVSAFEVKDPSLPTLLATAIPGPGVRQWSDVRAATVVTSGGSPQLYVYATRAGDTVAKLHAYDVSAVLTARTFGLVAGTAPSILMSSEATPRQLGAQSGGVPNTVPAFYGCACFGYDIGGGSAWAALYKPANGGSSAPTTSLLLGTSARGGVTLSGASAFSGSALYFGTGSPATSAYKVPLSGTALGPVTQIPLPPAPEPQTPLSLTATQVGGLDHLWGAMDDGDTIQRWYNSTTSTMVLAPNEFVQIQPDSIVEQDHFVFALQGLKIHVVDVSNPLAPRVLETFKSGRSTQAYQKLLVRAQYLYALYPISGATAGGIDVFQIYQSGSPTILTYIGTGATSVTPAYDFAVTGRHLFISRVGSGLIEYDLTNGIPGGTAHSSGTAQDYASIQARVQNTSVTPAFSEIVFAYADVGTEVGLSTWGYTTSNTFTQLSSGNLALQLDGNGSPRLSLRGDTLFAGDTTGAQAFSVTSPQFPSLGAFLPTAGAPLSQGGYAVGLSPDTEPSGPDFAALSGANIDGFSLYSGCSQKGFSGSVLHHSGLYIASCNTNGLQLMTAVDPNGGKVLRRNDLGGSWATGSAAMAVGESNVVLGGAWHGSLGTLWSETTLGNALGSTTVTPIYRGDLDTTIYPVGYSPQFFTASEGMNYVVSYSGGSKILQAYEMSATAGTWRVRGQNTLSGSGAVTAQPVTDGNWLFLPRDTPRIDIYDIRNPNSMIYTYIASMTGAVPSALAVARNRLYAAHGSKVEVWDVSGAPSGKVALDLTAVVGAGQITGLAVAGRNVFYTFNNGGAYGVAYALLSSTNRDGDTTNGAAVNTTVPFRNTLPLREPVVAGDVLYVAQNLGLATFDLRPTFFATSALSSGAVPALISESANVDPARTDPVRLVIDGPFAYLVGGTYRVFDLR